MLVRVQSFHRFRVAIHEAGHAVMAAAIGYSLKRAFLTASITASNGELGGFTLWDNPLADEKSPDATLRGQHTGWVVMVLLAGQEAEKLLSESCSDIVIDPHCRDWTTDNSEANRFLAAIGQAGALDECRVATRDTLVRWKRAVFGVAEDLMLPLASAPFSLPSDPVVLRSGVRLVPDGPVISNTRVNHWIRAVKVAEVAYLRWIDRGRSHGQDIADWESADQLVPLY